jgi:hypothetical protein
MVVFGREKFVVLVWSNTIVPLTDSMFTDILEHGEQSMITFTRQEDGAYKREGELTSRRAQIQIDGRKTYVDYLTSEAIAIIEAAIESGHVKAETYVVTPSSPTDTSVMPNEVKKKFIEINRVKQIERQQLTITCSHDSGCQEQYPRTRGRHPQKFCSKHRPEKTKGAIS